MATKTSGYILGISKRPYPTCDGAIITFGREAQNSVPLDDLMASRNLACIEGQGDKVLIKDLGSFNGTFVNDNRIQAGDFVALNSGDAIRIGGRMFYFISEQEGLEPQKAAHTRSRDLSNKETLHWDSTYSPADEEVQIPPAPVPTVPIGRLSEPSPGGRSGPPMGGALQTQRIKLNKAAPATLAGTLGAGSLPQIIQFIRAGAMSGRLQVNGHLLHGEILILNGELYSASAGPADRLSEPAVMGVEAVYASALEISGAFSFDRLEKSEIEKTPRNITDSTMHVIFECCRRTDESGRS